MKHEVDVNVFLILLFFFFIFCAVKDENDIDYLIGDLTKEEAQLIVTRLLRQLGEDEIRKQVEIVRHARNQVTAGKNFNFFKFFYEMIDYLYFYILRSN